MHAFLDDSGCGGSKFGQGSTTHLVMSIAVFEQPDHIEAAARAIRALQVHHRFREGEEYKFARTKDRHRHEFLEAIDPFDFNVRALVIDKRQLYANWRSEAETVKYFAIRQLMTHTFGTVRDAKLVIDGRDRRQLGHPTSERLMSDVNSQAPGTLREVAFGDSVRNVMLQLADMIAGSVHRAVRTDEKRDPSYLDRFRHRLNQPSGSLWHFRSR